MADIDDIETERARLVQYLVQCLPAHRPIITISLTVNQVRAILAILRDHEARITVLEPP